MRDTKKPSIVDGKKSLVQILEAQEKGNGGRGKKEEEEDEEEEEGRKRWKEKEGEESLKGGGG